MAFTALTVQTLPGPYAAALAAYTYTASDNTNGNSIAATGREILFVNNTTAGAITVTITSVADVKGRTQSVTLSVPATSFASSGVIPLDGFVQTDGTYHVTTSASVNIAALRLPNAVA